MHQIIKSLEKREVIETKGSVGLFGGAYKIGIKFKGGQDD